MATLRVPLQVPSAKEDAMNLWMACQGREADEKTLIDILAHRDEAQRLQIIQSYEDLYHENLIKKLENELSGELKLLVGLVSTYRYDGKEIVKTLAFYEANILHDVIRKKPFIHDEFIRIFTTRSKAQLIATFNIFKDHHGISISKALSFGRPDLFTSVLKIVILSFISPHKYFEKLLRSALNKEKIDENTLARIIVTRAEKDLQEIKDMYEESGKMSLIAAIDNKTSGHFKNFILELIGN
ncbi:annexin-like protein RJ4 [Dendrobium catenatum]|uniref:annexin-like protein RJ4 n=1 Tax=Dendrobium catenatum TaxID=906689 RepID=UPI00109FC588|nr:annexin-like protein RJ4 [Dendrobium catenatum]